jgi:hypothetical protein
MILRFNETNTVEGLELYELLAAMDNRDAMVALGVVMLEGIGVPIDEKAGVRWIQKAAEEGHPQGQFELATLKYIGDAVPTDDKGALELFEKVPLLPLYLSCFSCLSCSS